MAFSLSAFFNPARKAPQWRSSARDAVLAVAGDGEILAATGGAEALIGAEGGLCGRSLLDFAAREDRAALKETLSRISDPAIEPGDATLSVRLAGPGRSGQFADLSFQRDGGRINVLLRDRSPARVPGQERAAPVPHASTVQTPASKAPGVSPQLLADLGHELKTPLNAILGFADAMKEESFGPLGHDKYREYVRDIKSSGAHLADLIASLLDQAKLDAGRYKLAPALAEPGAIARECAAMVRGEAEKAGLALEVDIAPGLSETMLDARAVKQILINLLTNAVKFTAAGEITLKVSEKDRVLTFDVLDTGVGMSQMALARLGERFTGLHKSGVRGTPGAGLGLSLAFSLAKLHGGALELASAPGEGTKASLRLPVAKTLNDMAGAGLDVSGDIQSQLDRVAQFRRERVAAKDGRSAA
ncbi:PAS domain-containing sensor histidine kinase [Hyphococcus sp.]|uniref:PAS domain-containing sensor histidine kinase n=1 Tax=Hyphococcus sp. TaxID=2038636 RepID=UPI003D0AC88D